MGGLRAISSANVIIRTMGGTINREDMQVLKNAVDGNTAVGATALISPGDEEVATTIGASSRTCFHKSLARVGG